MPHSWYTIPWKQKLREVRRIQMDIVTAEQHGDLDKVAHLQQQILNSQAARLLAVKQVTSNSGRRTPGVDGHLWDTAEQKLDAAHKLKPEAYQPRPARRVPIPKSSGRFRPLGILTMKDRAMQALYLLALDPVAETHADHHSYGFRKYRSTADAISRCREIFESEHPACWVLEADIENCFDTISHDWLLDHIPLDPKVLRAWMTVGYMEHGQVYPTDRGLPQGGIISPVLMNMALDGLEDHIEHAAAAQRRLTPLFLVRYADDFLVIGRSKRLLQRRIIPGIQTFLAERGLKLSAEKTRISHVKRGITFLGFQLRSEKKALRITPAPQNVANLLQKIDEVLRVHADSDPDRLVLVLGRILRGWTEYYKHSDAQNDFLQIDRYVSNALWKWAITQQSGLLKRRKARQYFTTSADGIRNFLNSEGEPVFAARDVPISPHTPIDPAVNAYDTAWQSYLQQRQATRNRDA